MPTSAPPIDLVTGGGGFIGRRIADRLRSDGRRVRVLDLAGPADLDHDRTDWITGSVADRSVVARACAGVDRVFHAAGEPALWEGKRGAFRQTNALGTAAVTRAAVEAGVRRFVHVSSDVLSVDPPIGSYAASKRAGEDAVRAAAARGLDTVIVRPGAPFGAGDVNLTPPAQMLRFLIATPPPAVYDGMIAGLDVADVAEACHAAAERGEPGSVWTAARDPVSVREVINVLRPWSRRTLPRRSIPYAVAFLAALASECIGSRITGREPVATVAGVRLSKRGRARRPARNVAGLGVTYRPLAPALAAGVLWLVRSGHIAEADIYMDALTEPATDA
ncbi:MAG: NAD-dependent epimerase/dehydratase family protein [Planctomycetota bacterium]